MFVSLEGVEVTGKTTLINTLPEKLNQEGVSNVILPEFPNNWISDPILRSLEKSIFVSEGFDYGAHSALFYLLFATIANLSQVDWDCDVIIADRYVDSISIYQGYFLRTIENFDPIPLLQKLEALFKEVEIPVPDLTFVLLATEDVIIERYQQREKHFLSDDELEKIMTFQSYFEAIASSSQRYYPLEVNSLKRPIIDIVAEVIKERLASFKTD